MRDAIHLTGRPTRRGSPYEDSLLGIGLALHAKAAADIAGDHTNAAFRDMQDLMRQCLTDTVPMDAAREVSVLSIASPRQGDCSRRYRCELAVLHRLEFGALQRIAQPDKMTFQDVQLVFVVWV